ncbi:kelch domain-containing protein 4 [Microplitis mediator]|uniref:kelch domain-containing protein 4 n=1 Tax=Microplitis mediator TaxID=375433 RepID=UPI0025552478|nr:kelch domain-containing protein 4 [Microplitis mediator]
MGKKNKSKQKVSGIEKTAMKTEKKMNSKLKKELQAMGEDDIEKVVAQIEKEEAARQKVVEVVLDQPSRRVNFTLTAHPFKDELVMLGGEFHDGRKTTVYGDMYFYNLNKKTWTLIKAPGAPPPRCGHQAVAIPSNKGELWMFGGEFSSPSESQFYHYKDLWVFNFGEKKWKKVVVPNGPSSRSGHRMVYSKKQLFIFGGFHDNGRDFKYYNDLYKFDLTAYTWQKINIVGSIPPPRSGCIVLPVSDNKILITGGYSKKRIKKDVDMGEVHEDMYVLSPPKGENKDGQWKSVDVKQFGVTFPARCSSSAVLVSPTVAYVFGGVYDDVTVEDEEELHGTFFNDLLALDIEKRHWKIVTVTGDKEKSKRRRRKDDPDAKDDGDDKDDDEDDKEKEENPEPTKVVVDDGVFTMTLGPAPATPTCSVAAEPKTQVFTPSPRINPGLVVKNNVLYLYGGLYEDGDRQYTFNDFYSLDLHKLNEWQTIVPNDVSSQVWLDSESSESESDSDDSSDDEDMDVD